MSVEVEAKVEIQVECSVCGSSVNAHIGEKYSWSKDVILMVTPCEHCLNVKYEEGKIDAE